MSMMSEIAAAMDSAGVTGRYEWYEAEIARVGREIDAVRASDVGEDEARAMLHDLLTERRYLRWHRSRMLESYAAQVALAGV